MSMQNVTEPKTANKRLELIELAKQIDHELGQATVELDAIEYSLFGGESSEKSLSPVPTSLYSILTDIGDKATRLHAALQNVCHGIVVEASNKRVSGFSGTQQTRCDYEGR